VPTRLIVTLVAALLLVAGIQPAGHAADDDALAAAKQRARELVQSIAPPLGCNASIVSVKPSRQTINTFFVRFSASGVRCDEALRTLNERGNPDRLFFINLGAPQDADPDEPDGSRDLIHEIDPPIE